MFRPENGKLCSFNVLTLVNLLQDYLSPEAVRNFIEMTHEAYYNHFKEYFGTVITGSSLMNLLCSMLNTGCGRTSSMKKFEDKFGFSPVLMYPAMWYNIVLRLNRHVTICLVFGQNYMQKVYKTSNDWSLAHGITATGHTAPEEVLNPVNSCGRTDKIIQIPRNPWHR